jgi:predicted flap endonuclease-1-like 5' DNA nuclease
MALNQQQLNNGKSAKYQLFEKVKELKAALVDLEKSIDLSVARKAAKSVINEEEYDFTTIKGVGKKIDNTLKAAGFNSLEKLATVINHLDNLEDKKNELKKVLEEPFFTSKILEKLVSLADSKSK